MSLLLSLPAAGGPLATTAEGWALATLLEGTDDGLAYNVRVATNGAGMAIFTWTQYTPSNDAIHARLFDLARGWGEASLIQTDLSAPGDQAFPVMDAAGNAVVTWISYGSPQQVWVARYEAASGWGKAVRIDTGADSADRARAAIDGAGNVMATWQQSDGTKNDIWAARFVVGSGWGTAARIEAADGGAVQASVASDVAGNAVAVWAQTDAGVRKATVNRFVAGTGWGTATIVDTNGAGNATVPYVAMGLDGRTVAIWTKSDGARTSTWSTFYSGATGWSAPGLVETDDSTNTTASAVAMDSSGEAIALFLRCGATCAPWAARANASGVWEAPFTLGLPGQSNSGPPRLAMNSRGDAAAVWPQDTGGQSDTWATLFTPAGGWQSPRRIETDNRGNANTANIALDNQGNAYAAWDDYDGVLANAWSNVYRAPMAPDTTAQDRIDALENRLAEQDLELQKADNDLDAANTNIERLSGQLVTLSIVAVLGLFAGIAGIGMAVVVSRRSAQGRGPKAPDSPGGGPPAR